MPDAVIGRNGIAIIICTLEFHGKGAFLGRIYPEEAVDGLEDTCGLLENNVKFIVVRRDFGSISKVIGLRVPAHPGGYGGHNFAFVFTYGLVPRKDGFFYTDYNNETRSNWTDDIPMVKGEDGIWKTEKAWPMEAGVEFKVRQGLSWDNAFPADNFKVEEAGTYFVTFDEATGTVALVAE